jgi:dTDP-4-dehydrorhamnose 3,5-epimerase
MKRDLSELSGLELIENKVFHDERGDLNKIQIPENFVFSSVIYSNNILSGTVRGLHFQNRPYGEVKMITCIKGEIVDFIVDVRDTSKTFGDWAEIGLSSKHANSLLVPEGFAHGYQTLEDSTTVLYSISGPHKSEHSVVMNIQDPDLGIVLPMEISKISSRDLEGQSFKFFREKFSPDK